jgi:GNAT superfamily N-acetyltransferase
VIDTLARFHALPAAGIDPADRLRLAPGSRRDYQRLARYHYRPGLPATCIRILTMRDAGDDPIAILIISMPALNAPWRARAWPGLFDIPDKQRCAAIVNTSIRAISRLIVDPRWRGMGIGRHLVQAYLHDPLTPFTEAIAAMGDCCPVFTAAGMGACPIPPARHDQRLARLLRTCGLSPWQLIDPARHRRLSRSTTRALRTWARASRAHRALADGPLSPIALRAAAALSHPRTAYIHEVPGANTRPKPRAHLPPHTRSPLHTGHPPAYEGTDARPAL